MITIVKKIDVRENLERLHDLQRARVDKMAAAELQSNEYNPEIRKEMTLQINMLKQLTEFYFAIGELKKAPKTTTVQNNGTTTTIESEGRTHVLLSIQEKAQLQEARKKLDALLEEERKDKGLLH